MHKLSNDELEFVALVHHAIHNTLMELSTHVQNENFDQQVIIVSELIRYAHGITENMFQGDPVRTRTMMFRLIEMYNPEADVKNPFPYKIGDLN